MSEMRETIMAAARPMVQALGYGGLSFRELAKQVGIKSASIHYHFPTKGDLAAALAARYADDARAALARLSAELPDASARLRKYAGLFRLALENGNRMCLCGFMAAEFDALPERVRLEVRGFADVNVAWLAGVLSEREPGVDPAAAKARAMAIYAAIAGAQLTARSRADVAVFDGIVASYRATGLIPA